MRKKKQYQKDFGPQDPPPDVVVKFRNEVELPYIDNLENYLVDKQLAPWKDLAAQFPGISIQRGYDSPDEVQKLEDDAFGQDSPDRPHLLKYFRVEAPLGTNRRALSKSIGAWEITEFSYVPLPLAFPPAWPSSIPANLADQRHLDPAPLGIGAEQIWSPVLNSPSHGDGMQFIDIERGWLLNHPSFMNGVTPVFSVADPALSIPSVIPGEMSHGTSVLGTVAAPNFGGQTLGVAFGAHGRVVSTMRPAENIHKAITKAAALLRPGDVVLIEAQVRKVNKFWPVEVNQWEYDEIRTATRKGIVVIEAAGNGTAPDVSNPRPGSGNSLDGYMVGTQHILNRNLPEEFRDDSGAIMVGSATRDGRHQRMRRWNGIAPGAGIESNYGSRVDCYAWGELIYTTTNTTTAIPTSPNPTFGVFGGTSGASAMIAGVALIVQALAKANGLGDYNNPASPNHKTFKPGTLRDILKNAAYGTPSATPSGINADKIGVMPDLKKIIELKLGLVLPLP